MRGPVGSSSQLLLTLGVSTGRLLVDRRMDGKKRKAISMGTNVAIVKKLDSGEKMIHVAHAGGVT